MTAGSGDSIGAVIRETRHGTRTERKAPVPREDRRRRIAGRIMAYVIFFLTCLLALAAVYAAAIGWLWFCQ
jgi:fatty acid desaturase